jgi:hypothetical protein
MKKRREKRHQRASWSGAMAKYFCWFYKSAEQKNFHRFFVFFVSHHRFLLNFEMDQSFSATNSELTKSGPVSPPTKRPCVEDPSSSSSSSSLSSSFPSEVSSPQEDAFADLKLTPQTVLDSLQRAECPSCHLKRKYFCYGCYIPFGNPQLIPKIDLPFFIDV